MHEAFGGEPIDLPVQVDPCVTENPTHVADVASDAMAAACSQMFVVEVENEGDDTEPFFHPCMFEKLYIFICVFADYTDRIHIF